jgi:hypothetical protein
LSQAAGATLDLKEFVDNVELLVDGKAIDSKFTTKKDELRVSFDEQEIAINKSATFTVNVSLKDFDEFGANVKLHFEDSSDINVLEAKNKVRVSVYNKVGATNTFDNTLTASNYIFNG